MNEIINELRWRGLLYQTSNLELLELRFKKGPLTLYSGFDPTADSLHVGNLVPLINLVRFQIFGHKPIALIGGATALIGDPSGKIMERSLKDQSDIIRLSEQLEKQIKHLLNFGSSLNSAIVLNNIEWTNNINLIEFLRNVGKSFSINFMLSKESVKNRLNSTDTSLSFAEFAYMLIQANDYQYLHQNYNCELQIGGSDQWGNITTGIELVKKKSSIQVHGLTFPLLLTASGKKFGKSEEGNIWLSSDKTSPFSFYQFWFNSDDKDVIKFLKIFTFLQEDEIESLEKELINNPEKRIPHKRLAEEVTKFVHGKEGLDEALLTTNALFGKDDIDTIPPKTLELLCNTTRTDENSDFNKLKNINNLIVQLELADSKSRARELIKSGGIYLNNVKITDTYYKIDVTDLLFGKYLIVRKGKRTFKVVSMLFDF